MKLIKFKTELTYSQLVTEFERIPMSDLEFIINLSNYFDYIDVNFENNKTGLFGIMADCYKERIEEFFQKYSIPYKSSDISKDIFFDNVVEFSKKDDEKEKNVARIFQALESTEEKKEKLIKEDIDKMNRMLGYKKKTQ